jgi:glycosyltransferase involved in cell wall biosynthesis
MDSGPLVSIVTPFYNTEKYLAECIESGLRQTYENWEYFLVDNCSTDGSSAIAAGYASRFPGKIRHIRTESFLSQIQNYNFALSRISPQSKYCKIIQADDWLFPDCVRSMVEVAEAHPSVGIVSAYELEGDEIRLDGLPYPSAETSGRDICRLYFLKHKYLFGSPTSLLMRSDAVRSRNPFYEERRAPFDDGHACFDLLKTWNFGFVHQVLTYTRRQPGSIISPLQSEELDFLVRLVMLVAHGRDYLSEEEYSIYLRGAEQAYFPRVTRAALRPEERDPYFWEFHKKALASVSYALDSKTLRRWMLRAMILRGRDFIWSRLNKIIP